MAGQGPAERDKGERLMKGDYLFLIGSTDEHVRTYGEGRICASCGNPLSRYNRFHKCYACMDKEYEREVMEQEEKEREKKRREYLLNLESKRRYGREYYHRRKVNA
jgi:hypothetical protein